MHSRNDTSFVSQELVGSGTQCVLGILEKSETGSSARSIMADRKPWFYTLRKHKKKSIAGAIFAGWLANYGIRKYR